MAVRYWDYWTDSEATSTATTTGYFKAWSNTSGSGLTNSTWSTMTTTCLQQVVTRYVITGFDDWSDTARAVLTRLVNDETNTGFKITMWMKDVEITDPSIMVRDSDWFMLRLRQVASSADYEKIAAHVAQVRAELAGAQ